MISELLVMVMNAPGSMLRTYRRSYMASRRVSTVFRMMTFLPE